MEFDFKAMQAKMSQELAESSNTSENGENGSGYPLVYVGNNGKLIVKLLFNPATGGLQRKLIRHPADAEGKAKVPCFSAYGEECPICSAIKEIDTIKGDDSGAFRKYGYKARGICYAQIIDYDPVYFTKDKDPKRGDVVMLMYPKTVYDKMNKLMVDAGDNVGKLIASNSGFATVINRSPKGKFFEYELTIDALRGEVKSFDSVAEYEELLGKLPNLNEAFMPSMPTEELREKAKAVAEAIKQEFLGGQVVNPTVPSNTATTATNTVPVTPTVIPETPISNPDAALGLGESELPFDLDDNEPVVPVTPVEEPKPVVATAPTVTSTKPGMPPCFGKHSDTDSKCMDCEFECDCVMAE